MLVGVYQDLRVGRRSSASVLLIFSVLCCLWKGGNCDRLQMDVILFGIMLRIRCRPFCGLYETINKFATKIHTHTHTHTNKRLRQSAIVIPVHKAALLAYFRPIECRQPPRDWIIVIFCWCDFLLLFLHALAHWSPSAPRLTGARALTHALSGRT